MRIQSEQNPQKAASNKLNFGVILSLLPYVWQFKWRVGLALLCLVLAKVASVILPIFLKDIVDQLSMPTNALVLPVAALLAYGLARVSSSLFGELRDALFAKVTQGSIRKIAKRIFEHLFGLSMR